jgi:hypothetical protein
VSAVRRAEGERGAVAVLVALLLVVLMGFAALAVDVSSLYQERRELQNGADAAALAVAEECTEGPCAPEVAAGYADLNADDGASGVEEVCGSGPGLAPCPAPPSLPAGVAGWVRVTTDTVQAGSADPERMSFLLAPVLKLVGAGPEVDGQAVRASATAAWGHPSGMTTTLPLIISMCEFETPVEPPFTGAPTVISFQDSSHAGTCPSGPSGFDMPGGFGWLDVGGACQVQVSEDGWIDNSTGVSGPSCVNLAPFRNTTILLPMFKATNGLTGNNLRYQVQCCAAFHLTGYRFPGTRWPSSMTCPGSGGSGTCIRGYFTTATAPAAGAPLGGADLGVTIIRLVG